MNVGSVEFAAVKATGESSVESAIGYSIQRSSMRQLEDIEPKNCTKTISAIEPPRGAPDSSVTMGKLANICSTELFEVEGFTTDGKAGATSAKDRGIFKIAAIERKSTSFSSFFLRSHQSVTLLLVYSKIERKIDFFVMMIIFLDTCLVFFESDDEEVPSPLWVVIASWIFLSVYVIEIGFRLHITKPKMLFFRKRFYVFDFLIVLIYLVLSIAAVMPALASAVRAIRLARLLRILRLLRVVRLITRFMGIWHECNKQRLPTCGKKRIMQINVKLPIISFKLEKILDHNNFLDSVRQIERGGYAHEYTRKETLSVRELYKIASILKEEEDRKKFNLDSFCLEWLMLLVCWVGWIFVLSWIFIVLERDQYEKLIDENEKLKSLVDNTLPVRDQIPTVLSALTSCNVTDSIVSTLNSSYWNYPANHTFWREIESLEGTYTFNNPWSFTGSIFFVISMATTIGWGIFTPLTTTGQLLVITTALPTIYFTLLLGQKNMDLLNNGICRTQYDSLSLLIFFAIISVGVFTAIFGYILRETEGWSMMESVYFCWVSISTIGFGDYAPMIGGQWTDIVLVLFLIIGWNIVSFVIGVIGKTSTRLKELDWWHEAKEVYRESSLSPRAAEIDIEIRAYENRIMLLELEREQLEHCLSNRKEIACRFCSTITVNSENEA